nr:Dihydrofolate reductase [uncultured bacterium]
MNKPLISLIAALSENRVIGNRGEIPWQIPGEQKRFKEITTPHPIIMGRKTYESIGRLLPNRPNIIITGDHTFQVEGGHVVHTLDDAIKKAQELDKDEVFVIGGGKVFAEVIDKADKLYLTIIHKEYEGDAYFPDYSQFSNITEKEEKSTDSLSYTFLTLIR